jgi:multidrug efflux pump subunit AcrA (membrane-fusion protein)
MLTIFKKYIFLSQVLIFTPENQSLKIMSSTKVILPIILILFVAAGYFYFNQKEENPQQQNLLTKVTKGEFFVHVTATGELNAKRSQEIKAPQGMRSAQIYQTNITDMIVEGTLVKEGDYVASLDKTELETKMKDAMTEVEKIETQLAQAEIDTAIEMRGIRDQLINLKFAKQEKLLQVEQSKFEARSVIQQAEIDLQRTERDYNQLLTKLALTKEKSDARISEIDASLRQTKARFDVLRKLGAEFTIKAPKDGMLIYARSWNGKIGPGSQISSWNSTVAELPDLTDMISKSYVNEVDISKVKKGQEVKIKVDAFPDVEYTGQVIKIANIGEQLRNYDSKVFEVVVQLNEVDSILRPAMTTENEILVNTYQDVLSIPLEGLFSDSLSYVYLDDNGVTIRKEVIPGPTGNDEVIIAHGLSENDQVFLIEPENPEKLTFIPLDENIKKEIEKKLAEDQAARKAAMEERMKNVKDEEISEKSEGGSVFFFN